MFEIKICWVLKIYSKLNLFKPISSLFSIVNFPNVLCSSTLGDNGTCITAPECIARSGQVSGTCASGFGACCVLYNRQCGGTVAYNNTYLVWVDSKLKLIWQRLNNQLTFFPSYIVYPRVCTESVSWSFLPNNLFKPSEQPQIVPSGVRALPLGCRQKRRWPL